MPQFSYDYPIATIGQLGTWVGNVNIDSLVWPLLAQNTTVTVGTSTAGLHTIRIQGQEGLFDSSFTVVAETVAQLTDALAAAITANTDLLNIVVATSDGVSEIDLAFLQNGYSYTVSYPANPGTDLSTTAETAAGGPRLPLGIGLVDAGNRVGRLPTTGDVALDILGIVVRNAEQVLTLDVIQPAPGFESPSEISVLLEGSCWVAPEVAVAVNDPVFVRVVATGTEQAGALRNDADGGDAVQLPGRFRTAAAANGLARIEINLP